MAPKMIRVKPVKGRRIMRHDNPKVVIDAERDVPAHPHYFRAIARGDLAYAKAKRAETKKEN